MKPIIIEIKDGRIVMDVKEFKQHIEDAYWQGYRDNNSVSTISCNDPYWWRQLDTNTVKITCTDNNEEHGIKERELEIIY